MKRLVVAANRRYLAYEDGTPFFYLGDTAWQLFHRLNREEADLYLADRAGKGFTVIQAVVLAELGGPETPNPYGDLPLEDLDPGRPNEAYFQHVDYIVDKAAELGLFIGMLPTWGRYWSRTLGKGPRIFTAANAREYGCYLGRRYRDKPLIWILGGDMNVKTEEERAIIAAMAAGLREGDGGTHLITYHPRGPGRSAELWHDEAWLDFNMCQSSHGAHDHDNGLFIAGDYALDPPKPTLDGEPRYETIPVGFYYKDVSRYDRFDDFDVRQAAYWSLLAGACGFTYGNNNVWQMWAPGREPVFFANTPWHEALQHPGAWQMGHMRRLFESRSFQKLRPDQGLILDGPAAGGAKIRAARAEDGSFAFVYSPYGEPFTLDKRMMQAKWLQETWYDPRYGSSYRVHATDTSAFQTYAPPTQGRGHDWLLIIEATEGDFPPV